MKINHQDKAFIITFSSAAFLVLFFFFTTIKPFDSSQVEEFIDIPVIEEELPEKPNKKEQEMIAQNEQISHQIKNNSLEKEADRLLDQEDEIREAIASEQEQQEQTEDNNPGDAPGLSEYKKKLRELREKVEQNKQKAPVTEQKPAREASKPRRRTSISYELKKRNAIKIPNPVYTCEAVGRIVINIKVSALGAVVRTSFNEAASTTTNGCLVDQALEYASKALFNAAGQNDQLGSITFEFQG